MNFIKYDSFLALALSLNISLDGHVGVVYITH